MASLSSLELSLSTLFSLLLAGCASDTSCPDPGGAKYVQDVELSPERYAAYQMGEVPPADTTGDPTSSGSTTDGDTTDGDTTDGDSTSGASTTGGEPLSEQETCELVCQHEVGEVDGYDKPTACSVTEEADRVVVNCEYPAFCGGRRHACVASSAAGDGADAAAAWLARAAHDEAASVHAFRSLGRELAAWGAPAGLLARVEAAAEDEVRHAALVAAAARARGAEVTPAACVAVAVRDLRAIAVENAVEGCVHETWAALSAAHQARFAADPGLRAMFAGIAADEARHAELAWALDAWLAGQLDPAARAEVAAARRAAIVGLAHALARLDAPALRSLGVPSAAAASQLLAGLDASLWAQAA